RVAAVPPPTPPRYRPAGIRRREPASVAQPRRERDHRDRRGDRPIRDSEPYTLDAASNRLTASLPRRRRPAREPPMRSDPGRTAAHTAPTRGVGEIEVLRQASAGKPLEDL